MTPGIDAYRRALIVGAARGLGLLQRVPERFRARRWEMDGDRIAITAAAIACIVLRVPLTRFKVFPMGDDPPEWSAISGRSSSAKEIVEALELGDLTKPSPLRSFNPR